MKFQKKIYLYRCRCNTCIAAITIDSVMKMDKKNYSQVYLEEFDYEIKRKKMIRFIDDELDLNDL